LLGNNLFEEFQKATKMWEENRNFAQMKTIELYIFNSDEGKTKNIQHKNANEDKFTLNIQKPYLEISDL
jgi:hypothetical protein